MNAAASISFLSSPSRSSGLATAGAAGEQSRDRISIMSFRLHYFLQLFKSDPAVKVVLGKVFRSPSEFFPTDSLSFRKLCPRGDAGSRIRLPVAFFVAVRSASTQYNRASTSGDERASSRHGQQHQQ